MLRKTTRFSIHKKDARKLFTDCSDLKLVFVLPDNCNGDIEKAPDMFREAYKHYNKVLEENSISSNSAVLKMKPSSINHSEIYIFPESDGKAYCYMKGLGALILGPRCILECLSNNIPIPISSTPIFTLSMNGIVVSISGPTGEQRDEIKMLIGYMGGVCYDELNSACTHLVASNVTSEKYEIACTRKLKIMHFGWVYDVWAAGCERNCNADDEEFDKNRLPIFYPLCITSTGLTAKAREQVKNLINANGGTYEGAFSSERTQILILEGASRNSPKFLTAVKYKKECLTPQWVFDSVEQGYALGFESYRVLSSIRVSTPTKEFMQASSNEFNLNSTQLSDISHAESLRSITINETATNSRVSSLSSAATTKTRSYESRLSEPSYMTTLDKISLSAAKTYTGFLDGCKVYLSGFDTESKDKLVKIINYGGAIRFNDLNNQITHIIVGEYESNDMMMLEAKNIHTNMITLEWVLDSLKLREPAPPEKYLYKKVWKENQEPDLLSPASKKAILSMNHSFKRPVVPPKLIMPKAKEDINEEIDKVEKSLSSTNNADTSLVKQYLCEQANRNEQIIVNADTAAVDTEVLVELNYLSNKTVFLFGFDKETLESLILDCEQAQACIVDEVYKGVVDYVITPVVLPNTAIPIKYKQIVSESFIETAIQENKCPRKLEYYHFPIRYSESDPKPLAGDVVSFSIYAGCERIYISNMAKLLGAKEEEKFYKKLNPILIVPKPEGTKYLAAVKWGLTTVTAEWLLKCFETKTRLSYDYYDVKISEDDVDDTTVKNDDNTLVSVSSDKKNDTFDENIQNSLSAATPVFNSLQLVKNRGENEEFVVRNRRLSELQKDRAKKQTVISESGNSSNVSANVNDLDLDTPAKTLVKNILRNEAVEETPNTKRLKLCIQTPGLKDSITPEIPKCIVTPNLVYGRQIDDTPNTRHNNKRKLDVLDTYYMPSNDRRKSTPFGDVRNLFWKSALGDENKDKDHSTVEKNDSIDNVLHKSSPECHTPISTRGFQKVLKHFGPKSTTPVESSSITPTKGNDPLSIINLTAESQEDDRLSKVANFIKSRIQNEKTKLANAPPPKRNCMLKNPAPLCQVDSDMLNAESQDIDVGWKKRRPNRVLLKKFMFTSMADEDKFRYINIVQQLGAECLNQAAGFDDACTHLIFDRPNRGEKVMAAIAAGRWCLLPKYLDDSLAAGQFLKEEEYEWGNLNAKHSSINLLDFEENIANSCHNWRVKAQSSSWKGAFKNFKVILHVAKRDAFKRILMAGGGCVMDISEPYCENETAKDATHCFVDGKTCTLSDTDSTALKQAGVKVLTINYVNAFLNNENVKADRFSISFKSPGKK